jgi:hypothetical protein
MKVAVLRLQHSQWFGHFALSQTVWSFNSSSNARVRLKLADVGSGILSHPGRRGRTGESVTVGRAMLVFESLPERVELFRAEIGEDFTVHINHGCQILPAQLDHLIEGGIVRDDIQQIIIDPALIQPTHGTMTPTAVGLDEEANGSGTHGRTLRHRSA